MPDLYELGYQAWRGLRALRNRLFGIPSGRSDPFERYIVKARIRRLIERKSPRDDFYWDLYTDKYREELRSLEQDHTAVLRAGDYSLDARGLKLARKIKPLYEDHRLLYEAILRLGAPRVLEIGCGAGDHLANLATLEPQLDLVGLDRSAEQLGFLRERHPGLTVHLASVDIAAPGASLPKAPLVYAHRVLQHIRDEDAFEHAIANVLSAAGDYVLFVEDWNRHSFVKRTRSLVATATTPWRSVFFQLSRSPYSPESNVLLVSRSQVEGFERIQDDASLQALGKLQMPWARATGA